MLYRELKLALGFTALTMLVAPANAAVISLYEWGFNLNGTLYSSAPLPSAIDASGFDFASGLGTIAITLTKVGGNAVDVYLDHEIDESLNGFTNETGAAGGAPAAGQSWEIDEPGYAGGAYTGDIYDNFKVSALDNRIFYDANTQQSGSMPDDVSMALGWDFTLAVNEIATLRFSVSETVPTSGFYLSQSDPDSNITLYFYSTLNIQGTGPEPSVPEPATSLLLGIGLAGLAGRRYWPSKAC